MYRAGDTSSSEASQREQAGVIPALDIPLSNQLIQLTLGHHIVGQVQARVLPNYWLVLLEHLQATLVLPGMPVYSLLRACQLGKAGCIQRFTYMSYNSAIHPLLCLTANVQLLHSAFIQISHTA